MSWEKLKECMIWARKQMVTRVDEGNERSADYWNGYISALEMVAFNSYPKEYHAWIMTNLSKEK